MLTCRPLNEGALRGAQRGLGSDCCFRWLPRVGCQQEDLRARCDPCFSLYVALVCLPLSLLAFSEGNYGKGNLGLGLIGFGNSVQNPELRTSPHDCSTWYIMVLHAALHILWSMFTIFSRL